MQQKPLAKPLILTPNSARPDIHEHGNKSSTTGRWGKKLLCQTDHSHEKFLDYCQKSERRNTTLNQKQRPFLKHKSSRSE